jgi:uncharacterized protein (DUF1697 family)
MARYIAFLRAINVGGHTVKMPQLKALFESMGFTDVETFIASGNVIFNTRASNNATTARKIEKTLREALGYDVATFLRTDAEVVAITQQKLFTDKEVSTARVLYIGLLAESLSANATKVLTTLKTATEEFRSTGREIHFLSRIGMGESKFSNVKFEKLLGAQSTFRNMNTMERLAKKYPPAK